MRSDAVRREAHSKATHRLQILPKGKEKDINTMANNELLNKIEALNEWEALMEEARAEAEAIRDSLKQEMLERGTEELEVGQYMVRYQTIVTNHFNSSAFKKALPDVYKSFIRQGTSKRFTISA